MCMCVTQNGDGSGHGVGCGWRRISCIARRQEHQRSTRGCDEIDRSPLAKDLSGRGAGTI